MKILEQVKTQYVVAGDIETVRLFENYADVPEHFQTAWAYKNKNNGEVLDFEELEKLWKTTSVLYPEFSKVCTVSLVFLDKDGVNLRLKSFYSEDEHKLLTELSEFLARIYTGSREYRLAFHAGNYFDVPFLCKRYIINRLPIPALLDESLFKPWEKKNLDTNDLWRAFGTGPGSSLVALCASLGLELSKDEMVGSDVGKHYYAGNLKGISYYCDKDTISVFNILRVFKGESTFLFEDVIPVDEEGSQEVVQDSVMKVLYTTKDFASCKDEIASIILEKKPTEEEWPMLEKMITDVYLENEMFKADPAPVQTSKKLEVKTFFKELKTKLK